jgi:hypothetical protein
MAQQHAEHQQDFKHLHDTHQEELKQLHQAHAQQHEQVTEHYGTMPAPHVTQLAAHVGAKQENEMKALADNHRAQERALQEKHLADHHRNRLMGVLGVGPKG